MPRPFAVLIPVQMQSVVILITSCGAPFFWKPQRQLKCDPSPSASETKGNVQLPDTAMKNPSQSKEDPAERRNTKQNNKKKKKSIQVFPFLEERREENVLLCGSCNGDRLRELDNIRREQPDFHWAKRWINTRIPPCAEVTMSGYSPSGITWERQMQLSSGQELQRARGRSQGIPARLCAPGAGAVGIALPSPALLPALQEIKGGHSSGSPAY